ncbi:type II secretion system F family protein [Sinimarinibacterium sp. NLF-5-8]|uniref:type II secretion system F family protein n=1 Tax=Sinimarinibacterium sp. NLF-5-8 TaxID=2698684 RepID=UPI001EE407B2|nr:type II secretion system F family protein [Sinimarinibacterium sp. NLF-5-8]
MMQALMALIPLVSVFAVVLLLAGGAIWLFIRAGKREKEEDILMRLRSVSAEAAPTSDGVGSTRVENPLLRWFCHLVWRTGADVSAQTVLNILLIMAGVAVFALILFGVLYGLVTTAVLLALIWAWMSRQGALRRAKIIEQLPAFIEGVIRVLGAGNTLDESISAAAKENPEPIGPLFSSVGRQIRLGAPVESVLMEVADINRLNDLKVMAMAAAINRKYGGSLRSLLRSMIHAVRAREAAARELRALTAETRFSAIVLSMIPVALVLFVMFQNPDYYKNMWLDESGRNLLIFSVVMQLLGMGIIYRMMKSTGDGQ